MKLSFSTLPCMESSALELKQICEKFGYGASEVRVNNDNTFTHGDGLSISNLGSSICIKKYDQALLDNAIQIFKNAAASGIGAVRVFLGNFCRTYDAPKEPVIHDEIVEMLQKLCDSTDISVWVETHNEYATGKALRKLLDDVNRDNLKIIWDIIHPIEDGELPEDTLKYIGNDVAHVHIKDGIKPSDKNQHDYIYTRLGKGELPIKEIVHLLTEHGYDGFYSLEWESLWRNELKELNITNDDLFESYIAFMKNLSE